MSSFHKIAIFDLDGTLADTRKDLATGINLMRTHYGFEPLSIELITSYIGDGIRKLVERALSDIKNPPPLEEAIKINAEFYRQHLVDETTLYDGVAEGLKLLNKKGVLNAIITNKPYKAAALILEHFNIKSFFEIVIGGDLGFPLKPDPSAIFYVITQLTKKYNLNTEIQKNCWVIGDNHTDIAAANNASVKSIFVTYGFGNLKEEKPSFTCRSFEDVVKLLISAT